MNDQRPLDKRLTLVTGSAQGLGLENALETARRAGIPVLFDVNSEKLAVALKA